MCVHTCEWRFTLYLCKLWPQYADNFIVRRWFFRFSLTQYPYWKLTIIWIANGHTSRRFLRCIAVCYNELHLIFIHYFCVKLLFCAMARKVQWIFSHLYFNMLLTMCRRICSKIFECAMNVRTTKECLERTKYRFSNALLRCASVFVARALNTSMNSKIPFENTADSLLSAYVKWWLESWIRERIKK